jgi:hypothetical protein
VALAAVAMAWACTDTHYAEGPASADGGLDAPQDAPVFAYDGLPPVEAGPRTRVQAQFISTRVDTRQTLFAAGEMQTSGEPFAQNFGGRNLSYYDR